MELVTGFLMSMGRLFMGKSTGIHRFSHEILEFPVIFPLNQSSGAGDWLLNGTIWGKLLKGISPYGEKMEVMGKVEENLADVLKGVVFKGKIWAQPSKNGCVNGNPHPYMNQGFPLPCLILSDPDIANTCFGLLIDLTPAFWGSVYQENRYCRCLAWICLWISLQNYQLEYQSSFRVAVTCCIPLLPWVGMGQSQRQKKGKV